MTEREPGAAVQLGRGGKGVCIRLPGSMRTAVCTLLLSVRFTYDGGIGTRANSGRKRQIGDTDSRVGVMGIQQWPYLDGRPLLLDAKKSPEGLNFTLENNGVNQT
ncbi:hypothetical protein [Parapedobacter soli]|uniref:hypothetical protein n=1 Tax=Parapedobacter soli TaxID=416955 RepID=UPI0021C65DFD|nr:hypothetical protein [Parapedobacter soli]